MVISSPSLGCACRQVKGRPRRPGKPRYFRLSVLSRLSRLLHRCTAVCHCILLRRSTHHEPGFVYQFPANRVRKRSPSIGPAVERLPSGAQERISSRRPRPKEYRPSSALRILASAERWSRRCKWDVKNKKCLPAGGNIFPSGGKSSLVATIPDSDAVLVRTGSHRNRRRYSAP